MNGLGRMFYAAAAAIAQRFAERRSESAALWKERAERWGAKAKEQAPPVSVTQDQRRS